MSDQRTYILAGTYLQFRNYFVRHDLDPKTLKFVQKVDDLKGDDGTLVKIGTWGELSPAVLSAIDEYAKVHNFTVQSENG